MPPAHSLRLGGARIGVVWPAGTPAGVLVLLGDGAPQRYADDLGVVVLCVGPDEAEAAMLWAVDHASELGGEGRLYIAKDDSLPVRVL
jgi:hypothetical protein